MKAYNVTFTKKRRTRLHRYQHRWSITANNGRIIAASTEGYYNLQDCEDNALSTMISLREHFKKQGEVCTKEQCEPGLCEACKPN